MGMETLAAPEWQGPRWTATSWTAAALLALLDSWVGSHLPAAAVASAMSSEVMLNWRLQAWFFSCSSRCLIALTTVSLWPLDEPVRGREETILIVSMGEVKILVVAG